MFIAILGSYLLVASLGLLLGWTVATRFEMAGQLLELTHDPVPVNVIAAHGHRWTPARVGEAYDWQDEPDADRWNSAS